MKKIISIISLCLLVLSIKAQGNYEQGMQKAFGFWQENKIEEASNLFERIANAEKENWLPYYYVANVNITNSFRTKDRKIINAQLEKAQNNLNSATTYSANNPEIMVLQALLYTAQMMENPAALSQKLAPKIVKIYETAMAIAPENPRVNASYAEWKLGAARFFKEDTTPLCKDFEKSLLLFEKDKPTVPFGPTWGKERVEMLLKECNN
ncbi:tetratricopeptide repeat protein [Aquimarina agarilytica]|uniref:tetratricopeptide repeat protein n=1 Tax=Aquimarina agarilytica TaxID=1087449 RepID=UPI000288CF36|nr:hypothetical protein [Aquimarina agarilytica]